LALGLLLPLSGVAQQTLKHERGGWVSTYSGTLPAAARLRIVANGSVTLEGGGTGFSYALRVTVPVRSEAEARRLLARSPVHVETIGGWVMLTVTDSSSVTVLTVKAPRLTSAVVSATAGALNVTDVDGMLAADTRAGEITVDRIHGQCTLVTGGGAVRVGEVDGSLNCKSGAGQITVKTVHGPAALYTSGGDITADQLGGEVTAETVGGSIHIHAAGGPVTATTGGGEIVIDKANGMVTARNMAGPVEVGGAAGVRCENGSGGVRLARIAGPLRISTSMGSIVAELLGGRLTDSFLATGSGDITVLIPSNVGVNIRAENAMSDSLRRIISEYAGVSARRVANRVVAEGAINGGGPLLQISDTAGTIFIRKQ
jgi:DUF4097 and DUF4098 domain-containing protein YvlB